MGAWTLHSSDFAVAFIALRFAYLAVIVGLLVAMYRVLHR